MPDERDADNTFETYVDYYLPQAVRALLAEAGSDGLTLLGYCLGGDLALLLAARHPELPLRNLITVATPVDFAEMGMFSRLFSDGRLDADALIDATGNVPPESMHNAFRVLKPTGDVNSYVMLWQNLSSDEQMAAYQAMGQWTKDHVPFPGAVFRHGYPLPVPLGAGRARPHIPRDVGGTGRGSGRFDGRRGDPAAGRPRRPDGESHRVEVDHPSHR